jgi:FkbM family methyltransferase
MPLHGGFRLITSDEDSTGGMIAMPLEILRGLVGRPDCVIFDVGASTGKSVERFLSVFERATIHCFEPQTPAFSTLYHRFGAHPGIHLNNIGLADRRGVASLHCGSYHETASLLEFAADSSWMKALSISGDGGAVTVALDTIDDYCAERGIAEIDLLKLDVQGAEPECLRGAARMLGARAVRVIQVEIILHGMYQRPGSFAAIEPLLAPHGFRLATLFDLMMSASGELLQLDAVYVRD